ncbi:single-stranded-DNA-specific exonuclease RecJ, partial [bacterium]
LVIALGDDGHGHGSGRSVGGFHLARALDACRDHLKTCGGHEMAAGLGLECDCLDAFRAAFLDYAKQNLAPELMVPTLRVDAVSELGGVSHALVGEFERLGPFGNGNPKPLIAIRGATLTQFKKVGKTGDHLQVFLRQNGQFMKGIAFGLGAMADQLRVNTPVDLAVEPSLNEWNGNVSVELMVKDLVVAE